MFEKRVVKGRETKIEDKGKWSGETGGRGQDLLLRQLTGRRGFRETYATRGAARMSGRAARAERAIVQVMIRRAARSPRRKKPEIVL